MTKVLSKLLVTAFAAGCLTVGAHAALADPPRVVIEPRVFVPQAEFPYDDGYYMTHEGHYYHYDRDRHGWHYGRNHDEGLRWEREHEHHHHERY